MLKPRLWFVYLQKAKDLKDSEKRKQEHEDTDDYKDDTQSKSESVGKMFIDLFYLEPLDNFLFLS